MTSQEFGVIIVINQTTLMKSTRNYMGSQLIGRLLNEKLISKATLTIPLLEHIVSSTPSMSKEQLNQLLQRLKPALPTLGTPIASLA